MKVDDFEIEEITFGQERTLYNLYKKAYRNSEIDYSSGEVSKINIDWDAHDLAVGEALNLAIKNPDEILKNMTHTQIDGLGQKILLKYLRMDNNSKKE